MGLASCRIATWEVGGLRLAGYPMLRWDGKGTILVRGRVSWSDLIKRYGRAGDTVRGRPGDPRGLYRGQASIREDGWGLDSDDTRETVDALRSVGVQDPPASPARVAETLLRAMAPAEELARLAPRWTGIATDAGHQGPQLLMQASHPDCVMVDLRQAYLHGLRLPMPRRLTYRALAPSAWGGAVFVRGFARTLWHPIAAMPSRIGQATAWGHGMLASAWLTDDVRCDAMYPSEAVACERTCWLTSVADALEALPHKPTRRAIYTRVYGILMSGGRGWSSTLTAKERGQGCEAVAWRRAPPGPLHRPDVGAVISSYAVRHVLDLAGQTLPMLAHLDCLVVPSGSAHLAGDRWAVKASGPYRGWATGIYCVGNRMAAAGMANVTKPADLDDRQGPSHAMTETSRAWDPSHGIPWCDPLARSEPLALDQREQQHVPVYHRAWLGSGYTSSEPPENITSALRR